MPIYLARPGLWHRLRLLIELSLPGLRLPLAWAVSLLLFPAFRSRSRHGGPNETKTDSESKKYDCKFRPDNVLHFKRPGRHEINASCDSRRFFGQSGKAAKSGSFAGGDRKKSLRDLAFARTATGVRPEALVRSRAAIVAAGVRSIFFLSLLPDGLVVWERAKGRGLWRLPSWRGHGSFEA